MTMEEHGRRQVLESGDKETSLHQDAILVEPARDTSAEDFINRLQAIKREFGLTT